MNSCAALLVALPRKEAAAAASPLSPASSLSTGGTFPPMYREAQEGTRGVRGHVWARARDASWSRRAMGSREVGWVDSYVCVCVTGDGCLIHWLMGYIEREEKR